MTQNTATSDEPAVAAPDASSVRAAILARRNVRRFLPQTVTREQVGSLLECAVQAPNHRRTRPWRFLIVDQPGPLRSRLADLSFDAALGKAVNADDGARARAAAKRQETLETPVLLFVYSIPGRNEEETRENYAATACAVQNLQLAAVEEGLAVGWSTGGLSTHPDIRSLIGAEPDWSLVGLLYLGYPAPNVPSTPREGAAAFTRWLSDAAQS